MNLIKTMRTLHRSLGFFCVGLMLVYSLSGLVLLFRSTDFMKTEKASVQMLQPNLSGDELGKALHLWDYKVVKQTPDLIVFTSGTYDVKTGRAAYVEKQYIYPFNKMVSFHFLSSKTPMFLFSMFGGLSLLFLTISSFFMYKPSSSQFRRSMIWLAAGILFTLLALLMVE